MMSGVEVEKEWDGKPCPPGTACDNKMCVYLGRCHRTARGASAAMNAARHIEIDGVVVKSNYSLLPTGSQDRKDTPIYSGVMAYFPRAMAYIAKVSKSGNDKHNPGQPLHWSKDKSNDHADCIARHLIEHGTVDPDDKLLHSGKLAWRALALLETELVGKS